MDEPVPPNPEPLDPAAQPMARPHPVRTRLKWIALGVLVLGGIAMFAFRDRFLQALGDFLVVRDELRRADVIHVVAGRDYRADYAIELYRRGLGQKLFFTGGWRTKSGYNFAERARDRAVAQGVPPGAVAFNGKDVSSTYMEAEALKDWIDRSPEPIRSVIVVSDAFHTRRAAWTYRRVLGKGVEVIMAPVPIERTPFVREWWKDWASRKFVREEYGKIVYYVLRYQLARGKLRDWLASLDKR